MGIQNLDFTTIPKKIDARIEINSSVVDEMNLKKKLEDEEKKRKEKEERKKEGYDFHIPNNFFMKVILGQDPEYISGGKRVIELSESMLLNKIGPYIITTLKNDMDYKKRFLTKMDRETAIKEIEKIKGLDKIIELYNYVKSFREDFESNGTNEVTSKIAGDKMNSLKYHILKHEIDMKRVGIINNEIVRKNNDYKMREAA